MKLKRKKVKTWAQKQVAAGNCCRCGKPRDRRSKTFCVVHLIENRVRGRARGFSPWREGGPGRPPLL